jgi:hypothetical protein
MKDFLISFLPWVMSVYTMFLVWQTGNKWRYVWLLNLSNEAIWLLWIILSKTWGLLPINLFMWFVSIRNHIKWSNESKTISKT